MQNQNKVVYLYQINNNKNTDMKNEILTATKVYNEKIKMFQYVLPTGQVLITNKTEKGLDSNWAIYLKIWE